MKYICNTRTTDILAMHDEVLRWNDNNMHQDNPTITVAYTNQTQEWLLGTPFKPGMRIIDAIDACNILTECTDINLDTNKTGIFGQIRPLTQPLSPGDRVEIYNPLPKDPKLMRWERLHKQQKTV